MQCMGAPADGTDLLLGWHPVDCPFFSCRPEPQQEPKVKSLSKQGLLSQPLPTSLAWTVSVSCPGGGDGQLMALLSLLPTEMAFSLQKCLQQKGTNCSDQ